MIAPARLAAYGVLRAVGARRRDLPAALAQERAALRDERDRALAGEIAVGTIRWQAALDRVVTTYARRPIEKLDAEVVDILRLTAFQLLHLDRVPAAAAVNDAVHLVRKAGKSSAAPLVNAVLRRVSRERNHLPLPPKTTDDREAALDYLAITLSHPRWLVARWLDRYGFEQAEAWCRFNNAAAPLTVRANTLATSRSDLAIALSQVDVQTRPTSFAPHGLVVERGNPLMTNMAGTGSFVIQDEASQLVASLAGVVADERVLDVCASPGGKTTAMAADMQDRGRIVAADVRAKRIELLARTVAASRATCVRIVQANAAQPLPFGEYFDCVMVDAPCSGLGTLRRDPDIKWRRTEDELVGLADAQTTMLANAARTVRPGGRLIYSTCSSEPEENADVIARFLRVHPGFRLMPLTSSLAAQLLTPEGTFETRPYRDGLEAFYAAQVVKAAGFG